MNSVKSHRRAVRDEQGNVHEVENEVKAENVTHAGDLPETTQVVSDGEALMVNVDGKLRRTTVAVLTAWLLTTIQTNYSVNVPYVNEETGHWMTYDATKGGYVDTGKSAAGPAGEAGKSPFQYAVEGGYAGTEEEFKQRLARIGDYVLDTGGQLQGNYRQQGTVDFCHGAEDVGDRIFGLPTPTRDDSAANKKYVDDAVSRVEGLLTSHLEKIATLSWYFYNEETGTDEIAGTANIKLVPAPAGSGCYSFNYSHTFDGHPANYKVAKLTLTPPPGYAFTNLGYSYIPQVYFPYGNSRVSGVVQSDGSMVFIPSMTQGYGGFDFQDGNRLTPAQICLEVA